jgi:hypothetical protein
MDTRGTRALSTISDERRASTRSSSAPRPSIRTTAVSGVDEETRSGCRRLSDSTATPRSAATRTTSVRSRNATAIGLERKRRSSGRSHAQRMTACAESVAKVVSCAVPRLRARHPARRRRRDTIKRLVEPGGIAPPSERPSPQASTCVASSEVSSRSSRRRKTNRNQPQKISQPPSGAPGGHQPAKMAFRSGPRAARRERHSLIRLREQAARWQLTLFPSDLRG